MSLKFWLSSTWQHYRQPPTTPTLLPATFFLLKIKKDLKGKRFDMISAAQVASTMSLNSLACKDFREPMNNGKTIKVWWFGIYGIYDACKSACRRICNYGITFLCLPPPTTPTWGGNNISYWHGYVLLRMTHSKNVFTTVRMLPWNQKQNRCLYDKIENEMR